MGAAAGEATAEAGGVVPPSVADCSVTLGSVSTGDCQFETMSHNDWLISQGSPSETDAGDDGAADPPATGSIAGSWLGGATTVAGGETTVAGVPTISVDGGIAGELVAAGSGGPTGPSTTGDGCNAGKGVATLVVRVNRSTANPSMTRDANGAAHSACWRQRGTVRGGIVQGSVVAAKGRGESSSSNISANSAMRSIGV